MSNVQPSRGMARPNSRCSSRSPRSGRKVQFVPHWSMIGPEHRQQRRRLVVAPVKSRAPPTRAWECVTPRPPVGSAAFSLTDEPKCVSRTPPLRVSQPVRRYWSSRKRLATLPQRSRSAHAMVYCDVAAHHSKQLVVVLPPHLQSHPYIVFPAYESHHRGPADVSWNPDRLRGWPPHQRDCRRKSPE